LIVLQIAKVLPRTFVASRPATITLFGCLPPQLADIDEESKARHRGLGQQHKMVSQYIAVYRTIAN
jgi:hypothetical protein